MILLKIIKESNLPQTMWKLYDKLNKTLSKDPRIVDNWNRLDQDPVRKDMAK